MLSIRIMAMIVGGLMVLSCATPKIAGVSAAQDSRQRQAFKKAERKILKAHRRSTRLSRKDKKVENWIDRGQGKPPRHR